MKNIKDLIKGMVTIHGEKLKGKGIQMKRLFIILILTTILALLITFTLILQNRMQRQVICNQNNNNQNTYVSTTTQQPYKVELYKRYHQNVQDDVKGTSLDDFFYENNIKWNKITYNVNDTIDGTYYQISGLKDKEIEKEVNLKLKNSFEQFVLDNREKIIKESQRSINNSRYIDSYSLRQEVLSNFGNVISVANYFDDFTMRRRYSTPFSYDVDEAFKDENEFVNINLNNGSYLNIEDVFTKDADIVALINQAYHRNIRGEFRFWDYDPSSKEWIEIDNSEAISPENAETKIEKILKYFKNNVKISFGFTPSRLFISINKYKAEISLKDYNSYVAIYSRFLKDGIFDNTEKTNKIRAFTNITYDNSLLFSKISDDSEYYIYKNYMDSDYENKELIVNYLTKKIDSNSNGISIFDLIRFTYEDVNAKYKDVINDKIIIYCSSGLYSNILDIQDKPMQSGFFNFGKGNKLIIFGIENGQIIDGEELVSKVLENEYWNSKYNLDNVGINYSSDFDGRENNIYLTIDNSNIWFIDEPLYSTQSRYVQYTNIINFTGVT